MRSVSSRAEVAIAELQERRARDIVRQAEQNVNRLKAQVESATQTSLRDDTLATRQLYLESQGAASDQDRLNAETNAGLADPQLKTRFISLAIEPLSMTPAEFGKFIADETEKWGKVIRTAGIKLV